MATAFLTIDTSPDPSDVLGSSLSSVQRVVDEALAAPERLPRITHVKVTGTWHVSSSESRNHARSRSDSGTSESNTRLQPEGADKPLEDWERKTESEWAQGIRTVKTLLHELTNLESLEWKTKLPFCKKIWSAISPGIKRLDLDITISPPAEGQVLKRQAFLKQSHLRPLCDFRNLESLSISGMVESYQPTIWETVFRNPNLTTLAMHMVNEPLCRERPWPRIEEAFLQTSGDEHLETEYRGIEGTGHLHFKEGYGEYLDVVAMRKARLDAGSANSAAEAVLPVKLLRLEGFVVDALPFAEGFANLERVEFLANCFDAGFALPDKLRDRVEVTTTTTATEPDADSVSVRTLGRDAVQLITETVGELKLRSKSVPNMALAAATLAGAAGLAPEEPIVAPQVVDVAELLVADEGERLQLARKSAAPPPFLEARSSSYN